MPPKKDKEEKESSTTKKDEKETKSKEPKSKEPKKSTKKRKVVEVDPKYKKTDDEKRKRRIPERLVNEEEFVSQKAPKTLVIKKGKGKKLEDCENVATQINKMKRKDRLLHILHSLIFGGRVTKQTPLKNNLLEFSGVVYDDDENGREKLEAKMEKLNVYDLKDLLIFFGQDPDGKKEELIEHLVKFLEKPSPSNDDFSSKKRKRSRSKSPSSKKSNRSRSSSPAKKKKKRVVDPNAPKRPLSAYMLFCQANRKKVVKDHPKEPITEIAKMLGSMWNKLGKSDKKEYEEKHDKLKTQYEKEMKKYKPSKETKETKGTTKKESKKKDTKEKEESSSSEESEN
jgi:hypothetical protein